MSNEIENIISRISLFDVCHDNFKKDIVNQAISQSLSKGKIVFMNDDPATQFYIVVSGWIKLFRETIDGAQSIIDILTTGHMFGETAIFQNDTYPHSAEAAEPTQILSIPLTLLKKEIETNPRFALGMMSSMAKYRRQQDQEIENRTLKNAPQRIGCFLLRLCDQSQTGHVTIHLPYDKTLVAAKLGMQPETFSRALNKLKAEINMEIKGATIEIEKFQNLVDYACQACSSEFPCKDI